MPRYLATVLLAGLIFLACLVRIISLDADPYFPGWSQYVVDEGRWNEGARSLALFGTYKPTYIGQLHVILSPAYQATNYAVFRVFGVDFWSVRILSAVSGMLILVCVFFWIRRHLTPFALVVGTLILGFEANLVAVSRVAIPEMPSLMALLVAFLLLVLERKSAFIAAIAGLLGFASIAMKGTSALVVPVLPLIILLSHDGRSWSDRAARLLAFCAGFALPLAGALLLALAFNVIDIGRLANAHAEFLGFLKIADARLVVWRFFDSPQLEARNLALLGVWLSSWIWLHRGADASPKASELFRMSGLWVAWWLVVWSLNDYAPGRYVVHLVVPATLNLVAGLSLMDRGTPSRIAAAVGGRHGWARVALLLWLVVPSAILATTILAGLSQLAGLDVPRVTTRLLVIALVSVAAMLLLMRTGTGDRVVVGLLAFPIVLTLLWLLGREVGVFRQFWTFDAPASLAIWCAFMSAAALACFATSIQRIAIHAPRLTQLAALGSLATVLAVQILPAVLEPTYTIRDASRDIGQRYAASKEIRAVSAASLFLGNRLPFREWQRSEPSNYDLLVVFEHNWMSQRVINSERMQPFERVRTYPLAIHPRYDLTGNKDGPVSIGVFVRK